MSHRRKSLKLLKIIVGVNMLLGTKLIVKQEDLASSCDINNSDDIEHGGG